jgi:YfiH family protein
MLDLFTFDNFKKCPSLVHGVSTKSQKYPYDFSLALHTGENPQEISNNRDRFAQMLLGRASFDFIVANQTHSDTVHIIESKTTRGWRSQNDAVEACDALITKQKNVMLSILTADCVPILLYDSKKEVIAAVHAGWRGTLKQISAKTVQCMIDNFACHPDDIIAGIAPAIGRCCYEVGKEVAEHFFDTPQCLVSKGDTYMLDLPYLNQQQLLNTGLKEAHIEMSGLCTACHTEQFFSYRKEDGCTGRFMSMIGIKA